MSKKKSTSPQKRREDDAPDDAFVGTIRQIIDWGRENSRQVTIGGAVIVVLAGFAAWFTVQQRRLEANAEVRLAQVQQSVASGNAQLAIRDLRSYLATFGSTDAADQARLLLADVLINQDSANAAIEALGRLPQQLDRPFGLAAARLEAAALEGVQRYDEAIQAYRQVARNARFPYQRREALADAARLELQHGQPSEAAALFQQVVDTFDSDEAGKGYYEMWLAEARARARTGQGPTDPPAEPAATAAPIPVDSATG